ncbi:MAG TPA: SGNH/GDSL hydrolase family protein, partial [Actinomycetota bacterium]
MRRQLAFPAVLAVVGVLLATACTSSRTAAAPKPTPSAAAPLVYVAVGASESVGVGATDSHRNAWTQIFFRTALPRSAVFVNMAVPGSTLAEALAAQVPEAVALSPGVVTVWLNVNDLLHAVTPSSYEADLTKLVTALRRGGATKVLVANTPPLDDLPAYRACLPGATATATQGVACPVPGPLAGAVPGPAVLNAAVDAYNAATARVTAATGAVLVDLHAAGLAARANGTEASLVSSDGFHPSDAGYALVA